MSRRKKKDPPTSADWSSYEPRSAYYWFLGGPWIPPDRIEPRTSKTPEDLYPHEKPETRARSIARMLADSEVNLAKETAYYLDLHERGAEALRWEWDRERMAEGRYAKDEPNGLHNGLGWAHDNIARARGDIAACEAALAGLEAATLPLFHRKKG